MSPRPYRLGQRQAAIDQTRARVIAAARELLVSADPGRFRIMIIPTYHPNEYCAAKGCRR